MSRRHNPEQPTLTDELTRQGRPRVEELRALLVALDDRGWSDDLEEAEEVANDQGEDGTCDP